ncbi:symmetrical bis(5'-nucleosyl)-tetraphosphatase [Sulfurovum sp. zt1-1]|uniref:bis(5'-nucleosyl)-tetraphosphatase (symmetrical) n=1 Tax=Sulfurovum zhangzhouensis TaxID=3019067 RepID=A0ABT7QZ28_9BACT|nr:symmetrical bis(5'-nucleosyl)-tetraphosphatase [Sulfurovum zhangzhouensis]MDM5272026.1 symmetrical bis(5'-nucleosyl)-tetraphosphatase [Sulfurovum zhangzhouensis]
MAVWAIGDLQGCYDAFQRLLDKIKFDPANDKLWLVGDLVNRGEDSLATLEYVYSIRDRVELVLGNHDISLIAAYYGVRKRNKYIDPILDSPHVEKYIHWLRHQKFLHIDYQLGYCMAHAGISPEFDLGMAIRYAKQIEDRLQSGDSEVKVWLKKMFHHTYDRFDRKASIDDIERYILSTFTQMRFCYKDHRLDFDQKGPPTDKKLEEKGMKPWFHVLDRKSVDLKIVFGHWSALGFYNDANVLALDTGCVWNGQLTAARLDSESPEVVSVECHSTQPSNMLLLQSPDHI